MNNARVLDQWTIFLFKEEEIKPNLGTEAVMLSSGMWPFGRALQDLCAWQ